jgi:hypothetical protein
MTKKQHRSIFVTRDTFAPALVGVNQNALLAVLQFHVDGKRNNIHFEVYFSSPAIQRTAA